MRLYKNGEFIADTWTHVADTDALLIGGQAIVSLKRWRAEQLPLAGLGVPLGLRIEAGEAIEPATDDLARLAVIALAFPKFSDGRSYSKARALRERVGFRGELRAIGEILLDQIPLMLRCGFDAFEIGHSPTIRALERGHLPALPQTYQSAGEHGLAARRKAR